MSRSNRSSRSSSKRKRNSAAWCVLLVALVGIDPRYLANIENSGSMPSLPVFYELVKICRLPLERYFFDVPENRDSEQRQRVRHKLSICGEEFLPIIEGALDGALHMQEEQEAKD